MTAVTLGILLVSLMTLFTHYSDRAIFLLQSCHLWCSPDPFANAFFPQLTLHTVHLTPVALMALSLCRQGKSWLSVAELSICIPSWWCLKPFCCVRVLQRWRVFSLFWTWIQSFTGQWGTQIKIHLGNNQYLGYTDFEPTNRWKHIAEYIISTYNLEFQLLNNTSPLISVAMRYRSETSQWGRCHAGLI